MKSRLQNALRLVTVIIALVVSWMYYLIISLAVGAIVDKIYDISEAVGQ